MDSDRYYIRIRKFLEEVSRDEARRNSMMEAPRKFLEGEGISLLPNVDILVHADTQDTCHLVFPPDPNRMLNDETLTQAAGGKTAGAGCNDGGCCGCYGASVSTLGG